MADTAFTTITAVPSPNLGGQPLLIGLSTAGNVFQYIWGSSQWNKLSMVSTTTA